MPFSCCQRDAEMAYEHFNEAEKLWWNLPGEPP